MDRKRNPRTGVVTVVFGVVVVCIFCSVAFGQYSGGTGEPCSPYEIGSVDDLLALGANTLDYGAHFVLTADINLASAEPNVFTRALIAPDTDTSTSFQGSSFWGTFDGAGHKIIGMHIEAVIEGQDYLGLFGKIHGVVKNLNLDDVNIISAAKSDYVGSLVGYNDGSVENCSINGAVTGASGSYRVGGLVGYNEGTIENSWSEGSVRGESGSYYFGGLAGNNYGDISDCYSTAEVSGNSYLGGLVGIVSSSGSSGAGSIERSYAAGNVSGRSYVGGLVGHSFGAVSNCYAVGGVSGGTYVGGLVGYTYNYYNPPTISNCYSAGVISTNASYAGGLVGYGYHIISGSFWDIEASGTSRSDGGDGKTTSEMQDANTFLAAGWDFVGESSNGSDDIWRMPPVGPPAMTYQIDVTVPEVGSLPLAEAKETIEAALLTVGRISKNYHPTVAVNHVIEQSPAAGSEVASHSLVHLMVSLGPSPYAGGDGSESEPYQISTKEELELMADTPELYHLCFALVNDINLADSVYGRAIIAGDVNHNAGSFQGTSFSGSFDGGGHTVSGLTIEGSGSLYVGLFGWIKEGGKVENVHLNDVTIRYVDSHGIAPLAGRNWGSILNCSATGEISGFECLAGLVGMNFGSMAGCHAVCNVVADDWADDVGGLVGYNEGEISRCFALGDVGGGNKSVALGGLVGQNLNGVIKDCYSMGDVKAGENCWDLGGFAGYNYSSSSSSTAKMVNCYSTGSVCGYFEIGAFVGYNNSDINNCFWDTQSSSLGRAIGDERGGTVINLAGKTTAEMQDANTFLAGGWDFVGESANGTEDIWWSPAGGYPALSFQTEVTVPDVTGLSQAEAEAAVEAAGVTPKIKWNYDDTVPEGFVKGQEPEDGSLVAVKSIVEPTVSLGASPYSGGDGSEAAPYQIATSEQLKILGATPRTYPLSYVLVADINLADPCYVLSSALIAPDLNTSEYNFDGPAFRGVFDGAWHAITGLTINRFGGDKNYLGLFGQIEPGGIVRNLGVQDVNIKGGGGWDYVGGLAGESFGTIENCYTTGSLSGENGMAGGLVGYSNFNSRLNACFSECNIISSYYLGGLAGQTNEGSEINNCYATGSVVGNSRIGGLVGENWYAVINDCYAAGAVTAESRGGGLIGSSYGYEANSCFWDMNSSGLTTSSEGTGKTTVEMMDPNTFINAGWDFNMPIWTIWEGMDYPRLAWENRLSGDFGLDELWMYQSLPGQGNSDLTAGVSVTDDPMGNTTYSYEWEIVLAGDVSLAPVTVDGGGAGDAYWTFAARGCDEPGGLSDSGQTFTVRVTITGDDYGNTGQAEAEFGIALLGDTNNDGVVNVADRSIANAFWRTGSAGPYFTRDCDVNCDGVVNVADRSIANAIWRGILGQNSVSSPCPLR